MSNSESEETPSPLVSDYIQLAYLIIFVAVGAPLNLAAFNELMDRKPSSGNLLRMHLLKLHLNISDLLVVMVYAPSQACWLLTYNWRGGDLMCKIVKFFHSFSFQISSNVIVCIALNRLTSVLKSWGVFRASCSVGGGGTSEDMKRVKTTLACAWIAAFFACAPQLFLWQEYQTETGWTQCVSVWQVKAHQHTVQHNLTIMQAEFFPGEFAYNVVHIILVFWLPVLVVGVSYLVISQWLWRKAKPGYPMESYEHQESFDEAAAAARNNPFRRITKSTVISYRPSVDRIREENQEGGLHLIDENQDEVPAVGFATEFPNRRSSLARALTPPDLRRESNITIGSRQSRRSVEHALEVRKIRQNAVRVSVLLVLAYVVCWLPYHVLSVWELIDREHFIINSSQLDFVHGLVVFNSVINPFLYGMFGKFKRYTRSG